LDINKVFSSVTEEPALILVVDDIPKNIQLLSGMLSEKEYKIAFATNGEQALKQASNINPDLILLDIMMPEMDGFEVCEKLKNNEDTKDIPVIFLTGKTEAEDITKGFELGAVDYITKPFNTEELLARVSTHVELKKARDARMGLISFLSDAYDDLKKLAELFPICSCCFKAREDFESVEYRLELEEFLKEQSHPEFKAYVCKDCKKC